MRKENNEAREVKKLSKKAMWLWLTDAAFDWLVIVCTFIVVGLSQNILAYILAFIVIGNRQHALAILGHDGTHYTLSKNKKLNDLLSNLFAFWSIGLTVSGYRNLHFQHHRYMNTEQDPELLHRSNKAPQWNLPAKPSRILKYALMDVFGYSVSDYLIIIAFSKPDRNLSYIPLVTFHFSINVFLLLSGLYWVSLIWYGSLLTIFMMLFRLRTWLEHQGTDDTHRLVLKWWERFLAPHNSWYHWEHHHYPAVPCQRLPQLRKITLAKKNTTSLSQLLKFYKNSNFIRSGHPLRSNAKRVLLD